jgi:hypothetical protein
MLSRDFVFWEVDVQADFMLPGGKLYVPGAEKLLPNIRRLTDAARRGEVSFLSRCEAAFFESDLELDQVRTQHSDSGALWSLTLSIQEPAELV